MPFSKDVAQAITERTPILLAASKLAATEVKKVLRRLHVATDQQSRKEGMRPFARIVGKIALVGPFSVLTALIGQVGGEPLPLSAAGGEGGGGMVELEGWSGN